MKIALRAAAALLLCSLCVHNAISFPAASLMEHEELEGDETRKVLGSSVVTSVSVIMDLGNGSQAFADSTGRPVPKPESAAHLSSPPSLMHPDRYEFYTFNDAGDLVKRLMTMDEIQGLIAGESVEIGSDLPGIDPEQVDQVEERPPAFFFLPHPMERNPDWSLPGVDKVVKRVQDVLADVQNKITIDESNPSWAMNRPDSGNYHSNPTQNIPGSTLHLLRDPADKFSTFVPPVLEYNYGHPSMQETFVEDTGADVEVAPSSTPTLAPVSPTIQVASTETGQKYTGTVSPMPVSSTTAQRTTASTTPEPTTASTTLRTTTTTSPPRTTEKTTTTAPRTTASTTQRTTTTTSTTPRPRTTETTTTAAPKTTLSSTTVPPTFPTTKQTTVTQSRPQTSAPLNDETYQKLPEISVKPPSDQAPIKIPSTIIADLLIEDAEEVIRHDFLTTHPSYQSSSTHQATTQRIIPSTLVTRRVTTPSPVDKAQTFTTPKMTTTQKTTPQIITTQRTTPQKITAQQTTPQQISTQKTTPQSVPTTSSPKTTAIKQEYSSSSLPAPTKMPSIVMMENLEPIKEYVKFSTSLPENEKKPATEVPRPPIFSDDANSFSSSNLDTTGPYVYVPVKTNAVQSTAAPVKLSSVNVVPTTQLPLKLTTENSQKTAAPTVNIASTTMIKSSTPPPTPQSVEATTMKISTSTSTKTKPTTTSTPLTAPPATMQSQSEQQINFQKFTLPPLDELKLQMDQITQTLTDELSSSVKPMLVSTSAPKNKPAVAFSTTTTMSFGSSTRGNQVLQTGKTTPPPQIVVQSSQMPVTTTQKVTMESQPAATTQKITTENTPSAATTPQTVEAEMSTSVSSSQDLAPETKPESPVQDVVSEIKPAFAAQDFVTKMKPASTTQKIMTETRPTYSTQQTTTQSKPASTPQQITTQVKPASQQATTQGKPVTTPQQITTQSRPASQQATTQSKPVSTSQQATTQSKPVSTSQQVTTQSKPVSSTTQQVTKESSPASATQRVTTEKMPVTQKVTTKPVSTAQTIKMENRITSTTQKVATQKVILPEEATTDRIFETQMSTLLLPPVADSLMFDEVTSKTSETELNNLDLSAPLVSKFKPLPSTMNTFLSDSSGEDESEFFESTEKVETNDFVPFISQIFDTVGGVKHTSMSSEEDSTEQMSSGSSSEEESSAKPTAQTVNDATTASPILSILPIKTIIQTVPNVTYEKIATKSPAATSSTNNKPTTNMMAQKPTTSMPAPINSNSKPVQDSVSSQGAAVKPASTAPPQQVTRITSTVKPIPEKTDIKVFTNLTNAVGNGKNGTQSKPQMENTSGDGLETSALKTKPTNLVKPEHDGEDLDLELVSTTEYNINPTSIKHASTVKIQTKNPNPPTTNKPVNMVDKNNFKEVLDHLLSPAGILNFGDSSEETVKEDIYTTFIPASTTVKNTATQTTDDKNSNQTVGDQKKNATTSTVYVKPSFSPIIVPDKVTKAPQAYPVYIKVTPRPNPFSSIVTAEKIPDLEVSWQEPPEVVWTAQKATAPPRKPVTPSKYTTAPPQKVTQTTYTKVTPSTTEKTTVGDQNLPSFTKSNDEGMELIAVSDGLRPSTPSMSNRPQHFGSVPSGAGVDLRPAAANNLGLEGTTVMLDEDVRRFIDLNNDIAIRMYKHTTSELDKKRSVAVSPFGATSLIAMVFIGARGPTSAQINDFLPFDDMITFNPHLVMRNITDSVIMSPDLLSAAVVRQLYSQKGSKELLEFYKARAGAFYDGLVQQVDFEDISSVVRERTNELVKTQTSNKVPEFLSDSAVLRFRPPLAALSANVFQMNCALASSLGGRDGEMLFHGDKLEETHMLPSAVWSGEFMMGYDAGLDATAVEIPHSNSPGGALTSSVFVMPGKPGPNGNMGVPLLARLEARLISRRAWSGLLRNLQRSDKVVDIQVPRFEHRSVLNLTVPLTRMGLKDLFTEGTADLRGVNGIQDMYLSDMTQMNVFSFCSTPEAEGHVETYPSSKRTGRLGSRGGEDYEDEYDWRTSGVVNLPLPLRPRQARIPMSENPRIKLDRPFMYFVRHNPTGMILHIGRFNPRFGS